MATVAERFRQWWSLWKRDKAAIASGSAIVFLLYFFLTVGTRDRSTVPPTTFNSFSPDSSPFVPISIVTDAINSGAFCLDGSPPAYHLDRGFGNGADKWVIHLEGGGWCRSLEECALRKEKVLGSSKLMESEIPFYGILSHTQSLNPDFYNWNRVKVRYCDGASFSGDVQSSMKNYAKLFFRGKRIWEVIMNELLSKGLSSAKEALLTGCSAGGLATFIHCDKFRALLPKETIVKCLADGGFFIDTKDITGKRTMRSFYKDVVHLQDVTKDLQEDCISIKEPYQCFFPQEIIKNINTPVFIVNSAYDWWQIQNVLAPENSDPLQKWSSCKLNVHNCDSSQMQALREFRTTLLDALNEFKHSENGGMFIDSCFLHCQTHNNHTWHSPTSPRINNKTIAEAVREWYFQRRAVKEIDCAYPCNPTCYHMNFITNTWDRD